MHPTHRTLESFEIDKLFVELSRNTGTFGSRYKSSRNLLLAQLMLEAGLRIGEAIKLRFSDVFYNCIPVKSIRIRAEIAKTGFERNIPVSERLANSLKDYRRYCGLPATTTETVFLFTRHQISTIISIRQVERIFSSAGKKALGREITPHMLRHTFATRLMRVTNIRTVQELLGHRALSSTQIYTHPNGDDMRKAIDAI